MKYSALLAASLMLATTVLAPVAMAQQIPSITGTWKGQSDGLGKKSGWVTGPVTLVVTEQRGRSFRAKITYADPKGGEQSENLVGTLTPDGKSVLLAGDDGIHIAVLQDGATLDSCYLEPGDDDGLAVCSRMTKQP